jgi:tetratricopeptide (TPR) repeat protein
VLLPDSLQKKIDTASPKILPWALMNAGGFYFAQFNYEGYDKALDYFKQAEQAARKTNDTLAKANAYLEMANVYDNMGQQLDKALEYYQTYLLQVQFTKDTSVFVRQHMNIANILHRMKRFTECKAELQKMLLLAGAFNNRVIYNKSLIIAAQLQKRNE